MGVSCSAVTDRCRRRPLATLAWALGAAVAVGACGAQTGGNTTGTGGAGGSGTSCPTGGGTTTLPRSLDCLAPQFTANGALVGSFRPLLSPCAGDGSCPGDQVCFHLTSEIALCDVPQQAPTDAVCEPACDVGQRCNPGFTGATPCVPHTNYCSETSCASASDCGDGMVCAPPSLIHIGPFGPGRCLRRVCTSDQDCTSGPNGRCVLVGSLTSAATCNGPVLGDVSVSCVYSGSPADPSACAGAWACGDGCSHSCP